MKEKFVYFDLGNVLVTFDHTIATENLSKLCGYDFEAVRNKMFISDLQTRYETGLISSDQYVDEINATFGSQLDRDTVLHAISDMFQPNWPIMGALRTVQQSGVGMGVLSNTCEAHWQWLMQRKDWEMLHDWFEKIILSYEVKSMKPDSGIYQACEAACGLSGSQIFFTDDRADNIQAAADRGWVTHQYHHSDNQSLVEALNQFL